MQYQPNRFRGVWLSNTNYHPALPQLLSPEQLCSTIIKRFNVLHTCWTAPIHLFYFRWLSLKSSFWMPKCSLTITVVDMVNQKTCPRFLWSLYQLKWFKQLSQKFFYLAQCHCQSIYFWQWQFRRMFESTRDNNLIWSNYKGTYCLL